MEEGNDEQYIIEEEEPVIEITATDHINKHMLETFKQKLDSATFKIPAEATKKQDNDNNGEWDD